MNTRKTIEFGTIGSGGGGGFGATGPRGATGPSGGPAGPVGPVGTNGTNGLNGLFGSTGVTANPGATGATGVIGDNGNQGATGLQGNIGMTGNLLWSPNSAVSDVNVGTLNSLIVDFNGTASNYFDGCVANTVSNLNTNFSSINLSNANRDSIFFSNSQGIRLNPSGGTVQPTNSTQSAVSITNNTILPSTAGSRLIVDCITNTNKVFPLDKQILSWSDRSINNSLNNGDGQLKWIDNNFFVYQKGLITVSNLILGTLGYFDINLTTAYANTDYCIKISSFSSGIATITNVPRIDLKTVNSFRIIGDHNKQIFWVTHL
jgi:hypothetical protein